MRQTKFLLPMSFKAHFHQGKFSAERKFIKCDGRHNNDIFGTFSVRANFLLSGNGPLEVKGAYSDDCAPAPQKSNLKKP